MSEPPFGITANYQLLFLFSSLVEYGDATTDRGSLYYLVNNDWTLIVVFQGDKVVETILRLPYLCV